MFSWRPDRWGARLSSSMLIPPLDAAQEMPEEPLERAVLGLRLMATWVGWQADVHPSGDVADGTFAVDSATQA